ncbi:MAG: hypothetical protein GC164_04190 [Phycisphaera sp.]|nr:hypothetical protein [Phycisphaera sp.]
MTNPTLFDTSDDGLLISVYQKQGRTLDDLPYTDEFEAIYTAVVGTGDDDEPRGGMSRSELFHRLHNLRKAGNLPRMGRAATKPPAVSSEHEEILTQLVEAVVGKLSLRDRLPYTPEFDQLVTDFNAQTGLSLSPHDAWRVIAKLAK